MPMPAGRFAGKRSGSAPAGPTRARVIPPAGASLVFSASRAWWIGVPP